MPTRRAIAAEEQRQIDADDAKFHRIGLYFFELRFPKAAMNAAGSGETGSYIIPLAIPPEYIQRSSPFTVEKTHTSGGGGFVEENGIVFRDLIIRGTTGWRPTYGAAGVRAVPIAEPKTTNDMYRFRGTPEYVGPLSGQRHFQFLEDKIFNAYSELKRHPEYAEQTELRWHNPKDDEHWRVIPELFRMTREARRKNLYQYEMHLTIVGTADVVAYERASDGELSGFAKLVSDVQKAVQAVRAAIEYASELINEALAVVNTIARAVRGVVGLFNQAASLITQIKEGLQSVLSIPASAAVGIARGFESIATTVAALPIDIGETVAAEYRAIADAFDHVGVSLARVAARYSPTSPRDQIFAGRTADATVSVAGGLTAAERSAAGALPTSVGVSEARLALYTQESGRTVRSVLSHPVLGGDSLPVIAARHLGDARRWRELAVLNGLKHPYISASGTPYTLTAGDRVLVPSATPPSETSAPAGIVVTSPDAKENERLLGRDLQLTEFSDGTFDLEVDIATGSTDAKTVSGLENLEQALQYRVTTELGEDPLFKSVGYQRIVGSSFRTVDAEMVGIRISEAVQRDPRITAVRRVRVTNDSPDATFVTLDASVRGFDAPIRSQLRTTAL